MCFQERAVVSFQVVPTMYSDLKNRTINTNQYSVTEHFKESNIPMQHNLPGVFFYYDLSPIKVNSCKANQERAGPLEETEQS